MISQVAIQAMLRHMTHAEVLSLKMIVDGYAAQLPPINTTLDLTDEEDQLMAQTDEHGRHLNKIRVIKMIRERTGLGLKESKDLLEKKYVP